MTIIDRYVIRLPISGSASYVSFFSTLALYPSTLKITFMQRFLMRLVMRQVMSKLVARVKSVSIDKKPRQQTSSTPVSFPKTEVNWEMSCHEALRAPIVSGHK